MSLPSTIPHGRRRLTGRDPGEAHRASTPLELLYDLTIVVAIGTAADELAHYLGEGHFKAGIIGFVFSSFAITWAWLQYTWFASAYDTDDWMFRLATLVQMAGVIVIALGLEELFSSLDQNGSTLDNGVLVAGYVVMRVSLLTLWWTASRHDPARRRNAHLYMRWLGLTQSGWIALIFLDFSVTTTLVFTTCLTAIEMLGPWFAETRGGNGGTPWHPHHVAERYGLLIIITLGEGVIGTIAAMNAVVHAEEGWTIGAVLVLIAGLGLTFGSWWMYFAVEWGEALARRRDRGFVFGYGHLVLFGALAALGAGLHVAAYALEHKTEISDTATVLCVVVPFAVFAFGYYLVYAFVMRTFDPLHIGLLAGTTLVMVLAVAAVSLGSSVPVALVVLMVAPIVTVVGYETVGHRHVRAAVERL